MAKKTFGQKFRELCLSVPSMITLSGIAVLSYQGTLWFQKGRWQPLGSKLVLNHILPANFLHWLNDPHSWAGLKRVILHTFNWPLALFLFLFGMAVLLILIQIFDFFSKVEIVKKTEIEVAPTKNWRRT